MNDGNTAFFVYRLGEYITQGSLANIAKFVGCTVWNLRIQLKHSDRAEFKDYVILRAKKRHGNRLIKTRSQMQLEEYYNAIAYGLNKTGIAIGSYKYPIEEQKEELYKLGITGNLSFNLCKEGRTKWYRVELTK